MYRGALAAAVDPARWSDERLAARLLGVAFAGTEVSGEMTRWVTERGVGAIVLYRGNTENAGDVPRLTSAIARLAPSSDLAPLIAIDQEGGAVIRYAPAMLPSAMAIAATGSLDRAREAGRYVGCALRSAGIEMNLAPTVDLSSAADGSNLGTRASSSSPKLTAAIASAYVAGLREAGILAVAKHFPGQGYASVDPHEGPSLVTRTKDELMHQDLVPFRRLISEGIDGVMTAHVAYSGWPGVGDQPATFSSTLITDLLRKDLGFRGVVLTDALEMAGTGEEDPRKAAVRAIAAGADLVLTHSARHADHAYWGIVLALRDGTLDRERALESARRVLALRSRQRRSASCECNPAFPEIIARAAVTEIVITKGGGSPKAVFAGVPGPIAEAFAPEQRVELPILPSEPQIETAVRSIVATEGPVVAAIQNRWMVAILDAVRARQPDRHLTAIVLGSPYDAAGLGADRYIFAYSFLPVAQQAALDVLQGKRCAPGRLPVDLGAIGRLGAGDPRCPAAP